jgi:hypothetical protein
MSIYRFSNIGSLRGRKSRMSFVYNWIGIQTEWVLIGKVLKIKTCGLKMDGLKVRGPAVGILQARQDVLVWMTGGVARV